MKVSLLGCLALTLWLAGTRSQAKEIAVIEVENKLITSNADKALSLLEELDFRSTEAVILQLNCFKPMSWEELDLMMKGLARLPVPSYAFVDAIAVDAGAWLALATDYIYMAPSGIIGGSPVIDTSTMMVKQQSFSQAAVRSVVAQKDHNPELVEAFLDPDAEFRWEGETLSKKGERLILRASQAVRTDADGRPLLAQGIVKNVYELREKAGLKGTFRFFNAQDPRPQTADGFASRVRTKEPPYTGKVVVIEIREQDLTNTARFDFTRRALLKVERDKASAVILNINTPGGFALQTAHLANVLTKLEVPTYAYINPHAASAGALLALATDTIYVHPVSAIGAAAAVFPFAELSEDQENQFNAVFVPLFEAVSEANGHSTAYAEGFIEVERPESDKAKDAKETDDEDVDVEKDKKKVKEKEQLGKLLSLSSTEATSEWKGHPPLAKGMADSLQDLIAKEGLEGEMIVAKPLGFELLAQWVTAHAGILLLLAFGLGFIEMRTPGFGVFGFSSLALFAFFFFGHFVAGKLVGLEMVALFILGLGLILAEILLFPGTLIAGVLGAGCVLVALIHTMTDKAIAPSGELSPWVIDFSSLDEAMTQLSIAILGTLVLGAFATRFMAKSRTFGALILQEAVAHGPGVTVESSTFEHSEAPPLVGRVVVCHTDLRPVGKVLVNGRALDATTSGEFIPAGTRVRITADNGSAVTVRPVIT